MSINRSAQNIVSTTGRFLLCLVLIVIAAGIPLQVAFADPYPKLPNRSLRIDDATPGATTDYYISFRYPADTIIGSIRFLMCDSAVIDDPCVNPGGDMSSALLGSQSGVTGFNITSQSANEILISRAANQFASTVQSTYRFDDVVNPTGLPQKFFIRIQTYPSDDGSSTFNHASSVVSATTEPIVITSEVPPILYFCAALFVTEYCQSIGGNFIDYGNLSSVTEDAAVSQFGAATNAPGGYVVTINGNTMTAGIRSIAPLAVPTINVPGTAQFGLNLRANTNPAIGQDVFGDGFGVVTANYNTPDQFMYQDGDIVATSATPTLFNTFTVTYLVNVPPTQEAGIYNTTVTYICTAAF